MHMKLSKGLILVLLLAALLRLLFLGEYPAGLNADEAALGYNAYSLIQTGADEHGVSWPLVFRSFDDYKPPLYVYIVLPFVYLFGLTPFVVRLPSALLGIATVYLTYLLVNQLFPKQELAVGGKKLRLSLLTAFLLAISPWHLHFSRGAWEVNVALFFLTLGLYAFFKALNSPRFYILSALSFVASLYTYHSIRIIAPLLLLVLVILHHKQLLTQLKNSASRGFLLVAFILGLFLTLPLASQMLSKEGQSRFSGVSIFADSGPLWEALEKRRLSPDPDSLLTRLRYNRYLSYSKRFVENYLSHYQPDFLFISGDEIARSKVPGFGQSFVIFAPFFYLGLVVLFFKRTPAHRFLLAWLLLAPLAAALTFQSPHALRSQNMVIPFSLTLGIGILTFFSWLKGFKPKSVLIIFVLLSLLSAKHFVSYLNSYYFHYPKVYPFAWQYGFDQLAEYLSPIQSDYDTIVISDRYDQPYILLAFFLKYDPNRLQQELVFSDRDNFGFSTGRSFGNYKFHRITDQDFDLPNTLIVVADEPVPDGLTPIHTLYYPNQQPVFTIYQTSKLVE